MNTLLDKRWRIVAYLDGLPPSLRFGDASRQAKVNALREARKGMIYGLSEDEIRIVEEF